MNRWYKAKVIKGNQLGQKLGYPTLNLDHPEILEDQKKGVYLVQLKISNHIYFGLLYFGPRLIIKDRKDVIEIHVFDFHKNIYGHSIEFNLISYLREVVAFNSPDDFRKQLSIDTKKAYALIEKSRILLTIATLGQVNVFIKHFLGSHKSQSFPRSVV